MEVGVAESNVRGDCSAGGRRVLIVFDMSVTVSSPAGSCVLAEIAGLVGPYSVVILAGECDTHEHFLNNVRWIRVPVPRRPVFLRYVLYSLLAPIVALLARRDLPCVAFVQATQGQYVKADVCYAHFCHRAYLRHHWACAQNKGFRALARYLTHAFNERREGRAFSYAKLIVVPSNGLAKDIAESYAGVEHKISVVPNPIDINKMRRPEAFDVTAERQALGMANEEVILVFVALGNFAHKGLGLVLEAMSASTNYDIKLVVVGGNRGEISKFSVLAEKLGIIGRIVFVGYQADVRPYLWMSDVYVMLSAYETFSLAAFQAAAAGLPVVSTRVYGVEDLINNGLNGWIVERTAKALMQVLDLIARERERLPEMGHAARKAASVYGVEVFQERWRKIYQKLAADKLRQTTPCTLVKNVS